MNDISNFTIATLEQAALTYPLLAIAKKIWDEIPDCVSIKPDLRSPASKF